VDKLGPANSGELKLHVSDVYEEHKVIMVHILYFQPPPHTLQTT